MKYFQKRNVILLPRPAQSPDMNIIENFWDFIKVNLRYAPPRSKDQVIEKLFQIFHAIP